MEPLILTGVLEMSPRWGFMLLIRPSTYLIPTTPQPEEESLSLPRWMKTWSASERCFLKPMLRLLPSPVFTPSERKVKPPLASTSSISLAGPQCRKRELSSPERVPSAIPLQHSPAAWNLGRLLFRRLLFPTPHPATGDATRSIRLRWPAQRAISLPLTSPP